MVYKINYFIAMLILLISTNLHAQESQGSYRTGWQTGFQLNEFGNEFGLGLNVITPRLWSITRFQFAFDNQYLPYQSATGEDWKSYQQFRFGTLTHAPIIKGKVDVYGGGGIVVGLLPSSMSSAKTTISGTGTFGLAFYWYEGFTYFFEMGGTGALGSANRLPGNPVIGGGFFNSVGFRYHF